MRVSHGQWSGKTVLMIEETVDGCDCLLIPTLSVLLHSYINGTMHISAHLVLFDGQEMLKAHGSQMVTSKGPYRFRFQKNIYEYGLLQVFLPRSHLLETKEIDNTDLELFAASTHPEMLPGLASIPLPSLGVSFLKKRLTCLQCYLMRLLSFFPPELSPKFVQMDCSCVTIVMGPPDGLTVG